MASTQQRQLVATQLNKYYKMNARRSDLKSLFKQFSGENNLDLEAGEKKTIKQRIARGAAAFAAGYTAGKLTGMG